MTNRKILFTDGEGPIVTNDFAFEVTSRIRIESRGKKMSGRELFSIVSAYDDYLVERRQKQYESGTTLALVLPFFLCHGITDDVMQEIAGHAALAFGVKEYVRQLQKDRFAIRIISTAYRPLWDVVGNILHIPSDHIAATSINIEQLFAQFPLRLLLPVVGGVEADIVANSTDARRTYLYERFHRFYWGDLPKIGFDIGRIVTVLGGKRKVTAAKQFAKDLGKTLADIVYVGDSITDVELFTAVNQAGGLSLAVNGNNYALEHAQVAVATQDMRLLRPLLDAWATGGHRAVISFIKSSASQRSPAHYAVIDTRDPSDFALLLAKHAYMRTMVRTDAAALG